MLESTLEQAVRKYIRSIGGRCYKWVCPGETGVPDRICILPGGRIVFIELKRPGRKDGMSERQKKIMRVLQGLGCEAWRIDSMDDLKARLAGGERHEV
jgi:hypothetical protein